MNRKIRIILCAVLAAAVVTGISVAAATTYGTQNDPLITKSYLDDTLTPQLMKQFEALLDASGSTENGAFAVLTLTNGQTVKCGAGCEILLRVGTAAVEAGDTPGLVDTTDGTVLENGGVLTQNHLYMATIEGHGIRATAATVKVLVSGSYTIS